MTDMGLRKNNRNGVELFDLETRNLRPITIWSSIFTQKKMAMEGNRHYYGTLVYA